MKSGPRNIGIGSIIRYRYPVTALASIFHRISGVVLFLLIPFGLFILNCSLKSQAHFYRLQAWLHHPAVLFFIWVSLVALLYHFLAGVKHLLMDMGWFEELHSSKILSLVVIIVSVLAAIGIGVWLW